jgi:hypothetical protein
LQIGFKSILTILFLSYLWNNQTTFQPMPKGPEKNTKNKALHTKLLNRKKSKLQEEKKEKAARLKALVAKMNQQKNNNESNTE